FIWRLDMMKDLEVFPCQMAACAPLIIGDLVFVVTGNGIENGTPPRLPSPKAPSFLAINKHTGKVVWKDSSPGENIMEGQWSNPVFAKANGKAQVIFPGGDGWLYAFKPNNGELIWKFDCNPKASVWKPGGRGATKNYLVATPVVHDNKLYVGVGQNPENGPGV